MRGSDLRRYRKHIGLSQTQMGQALGLSQAALSLIESGKQPLTAELIEHMERVLVSPAFEVSLSSFVDRRYAAGRSSMALLEQPSGKKIELTVWGWPDELDLAMDPSELEAIDTVAVRLPPSAGTEALALQVSRSSSWRERGEILVFVRARTDELGDGDLCLVQLDAGDGAPAAQLRRAQRRGARGGATFDLLAENKKSPPILASDSRIEGLLRCIYRARYVGSENR